MLKKLLVVIFVFLLSGVASYSQVSVRDSAISTSMIYGTYSFGWPSGDLAKIFGANSTVGAGFMYKTKSNWLFGVEGTFIFGGTVKIGDSILRRISTSDGYVIDANGQYADIDFSERGYTFFLKAGKIFSVIAPNPNSGIAILAGAGFIDDKIRIHNPGNTAPQIFGDYEKGYDRFNSGFAVSASAGYLFMSNSRLLNMYLGFEFMQAWTTFRRDVNFDTGTKDNYKPSTQFYNIKFKWIIPVYKRKPENYYLY
jgi:hypothetical protein